jgi:hypothetical protein
MASCTCASAGQQPPTLVPDRPWRFRYSLHYQHHSLSPAVSRVVARRRYPPRDGLSLRSRADRGGIDEPSPGNARIAFAGGASRPLLRMLCAASHQQTRLLMASAQSSILEPRLRHLEHSVPIPRCLRVIRLGARIGPPARDTSAGFPGKAPFAADSVSKTRRGVPTSVFQRRGARGRLDITKLPGIFEGAGAKTLALAGPTVQTENRKSAQRAQRYARA